MLIFKKFCADESAATAIEYALIASGIAVAILASINTLGTAIKTTFTSLATSLK